MIGWLDLSSGVSGDMLLGALVDAGVALHALQTEVARLGLPIELCAEPASRGGLAATRVLVKTSERHPPRRTLAEVLELLRQLSPRIRERAAQTFELLAAAEAQVHGVSPEDVHFHEVGALDALADVTGVCAGFAALELSALIAGPIALGGGTAESAHGALPVPGPAVLELLRRSGAPAYGGGEVELCTPTGAALVSCLATGFGPLPTLQISGTGSGAGQRERAGRPNVVRLVLGEPAAELPVAPAVVLAANVDDLDPRAWPVVLDALLAAGADDAWLAPILMKKGRPAHTVSALVSGHRVAGVRAAIFRETSTLGVRETPAAKTALAREFHAVDVDGQPVAIKVGYAADGSVLNAMPEWDDVVRAAAALHRPVKQVLAQAQAAFDRASRG